MAQKKALTHHKNGFGKIGLRRSDECGKTKEEKKTIGIQKNEQKRNKGKILKHKQAFSYSHTYPCSTDGV